MKGRAYRLHLLPDLLLRIENLVRFAGVALHHHSLTYRGAGRRLDQLHLRET
jgi:hypothetical protein